MLNYLLLENKPMIEINGERAFDLLHKTIDLENHDYSGEFLLVNEYYVGRPDLISLAKYKDDRYADIICKLNGISNPFDLNEGMVIFIPTYESIYNILDTETKHKKVEFAKDADDIVKSNKVGFQREKTEGRSPANQVVGEENYIIDNSLGIVFY